jgi:hypothetical protein
VKADGCDPGRENQPSEPRFDPIKTGIWRRIMSRAHALAVGAAGGGNEATGYSRFLWGGLGALAPTIISLAILDHSSLAHYITNIDQETFKLIGYGFRVVALFAIGGLWAYFHRSEVEPLKLFQLGIVAPAMITGMINASNVSNQAQAGDSAWLDLRFELISSAHAADSTQLPQPPAAPSSQQSPVDQFINGVLGRP